MYIYIDLYIWVYIHLPISPRIGASVPKAFSPRLPASTSTTCVWCSCSPGSASASAAGASTTPASGDDWHGAYDMSQRLRHSYIAALYMLYSYIGDTRGLMYIIDTQPK